MRFMIIDSDAQAVDSLVELLHSEVKKWMNAENSRMETRSSITKEEIKALAGTDTCVILEIETENGPEGLALAEALREADEDIPIVFYTAVNDYAMICYDLDIAYYMLKPVNEDSVHRMMDRVMDRVM